VAGFRHIPDAAHAVLWLSDGRPDDDNAALQYVRAHIRCPIHAVAFNAAPEAKNLLSGMAEASQGTFHDVCDPDTLLPAFLGILEQVRRSRRCSGTGELSIPDASGEILVIGFDAAPEFNPPCPAERHVATLPRGAVHAARVELGSPQVLKVRSHHGGSPGRLLVIRFDLSQAFTKVGTAVASPSGVTVPARTRFSKDGGLLDPHGKGSLSTVYELLAPDGRVASRIPAQVPSDQPEFRAVIPLPPHATANGWQLRTTTTDTSCGVPFVETHLRALDFTPPPPPSPPPPSPPDPEDVLHLRVVAERSEGRTVLVESPSTNGRGFALVGDPISLELTAGRGLSSEELITLGRTLRAQFLSHDGTIRDVPLEFVKDHYRTAAVPVTSPGRLGVQVLVEIQGTVIKITGELEIHEVQWRVSVDAAFATLGVLPRQALVPYTVGLEGTVGGRSASREELAEVLIRGHLRLERSRVDSGGQTLDPEVHDAAALAARPDRVASKVWFRDLGEQSLQFRLLDGGSRELAGLVLPLRVVEAPVRVATIGGDPEGAWRQRLPGFLCRIDRPRLEVRPAESPLGTTYFVHGVNLDGQELTREHDAYTMELPSGDRVVRVRLSRYGVAKTQTGPAEIQLLYELRSVPARSLNYVLCAGLAVLALAGVWGVHILRVFSWDACEVQLWGAGMESFPLARDWRSGLWPQQRAAVYRDADQLLGIGPVGVLPESATRLATIKRTGRRKLVLRPQDPSNGSLQGKIVLRPDADVVPLDDANSLTVEYPQEIALASV
jgi:hypothetical protein